ncbi:MAG: polysaccharide biosynthesis protein [Firmicutes bacterium]|nr:polysaccharide biosynthesis protein [Bacillota bacterium]
MEKIFHSIRKFFSHKWRKTLFFMLLDALFAGVAFLIARTIFFNGFDIPEYGPLPHIRYFIDNEAWVGGLFCVIVIISLLIFDSYNTVWKFAGRMEFLKILVAYAVATGLLFLCGFIWGRLGTLVSPVIIIMFVIFSAIFSLFIRYIYSIKNYLVHLRNLFSINSKDEKSSRPLRTIVIGAGYSGNAFIDRAFNNPSEGYFPVALIDEDKEKIHKKIRGVLIVGGLDILEDIVKKYRAEAIVIAIVNIEKKRLKAIYSECKKHDIPIKQMSAIQDSSDATIAPTLELRDIKIEQLLGREEFKVNRELIDSAVKDRVVIVTGGAGSIGSELCRQSLEFGCKRLIIFDHFENGCFEINEEFKHKFDTNKYTLVVGSVRDKERLDEIFNKYKPDIVFHAAAYKHVPMMEHSSTEAIKNNVFGTLNVIESAERNGVSRFVFVSTDKAVNPANIMGASKRIAEMIVQTRGKIASNMRLAAVRFGNVLGSNGSVIPTFLRQIKEGGPVTVTHRDIKRYFMTIPEAVRLVLQAGSLAKGGDVFVLDMGEPVYIYDLAADIIRLNGLVPEKDIDIVFTGLRPGEKMFEELSYSKESVDTTAHEGIFVTKLEKIDDAKFESQLDNLRIAVANQSDRDTTDRIFEIVPSDFRENS